MRRLSDHDLNNVFERTFHLWREIPHARIFVTGGTGFVGRWLLETFLYAKNRMKLKATMTVLTRDSKSFLQEMPHLKPLNFADGYEGAASHVIHAAPVKSDNAVTFALKNNAELLFTSSGAIYSLNPTEYAAEKFRSELACRRYARSKIARLFTFVGPHLPLDKNFAIGNFIRDGLAGGPIIVKGDGQTIRSYQYGADMAAWLWTILIAGKRMGCYEVGSPTGFKISEVVQKVANCFPGTTISTLCQKVPGELKYVPHFLNSDLNLKCEIELDDAIRRTIDWLR